MAAGIAGLSWEDIYRLDMETGIENFLLEDVSCLDKQILVNGNIFTTDEELQKDLWQMCNQLTLTLMRIENIYQVKNLTSDADHYFIMTGTSQNPLKRGRVTYLKKTQWRATIETVDCAACDPSRPREHDLHEVVVREHGVYVTPACWKIDHLVSLIVDPERGIRTLINHTISDGVTLP